MNCHSEGKPVVVTGRRLTEADAKQAFMEWTNRHPGTGVSMRLVHTPAGDPAAEFTHSLVASSELPPNGAILVRGSGRGETSKPAPPS
jgi:hypothetical protein